VRVGAVEQHRRVHERLGLLLAVVRNRRDDREAGDRAGVGDLDLVLLGRRDDAQWAVPLAGHVHAAARRARVADDVTVDELVDESIENRCQLFLVRERDEMLHHQRLLRHLSGGHTASHASRSVIMLCDSPRQRGCTRIPVDMRSMFSTSTTCTIVESAPSGLISANANGWSSGCFDVGSSTHVHDSTVPAGPTSTMSVRASPVYGSYSSGGTRTCPSCVRMPRILCSRSPARNAPTTGPTVREYGNSSVLLVVLVTAPKLRPRARS